MENNFFVTLADFIFPILLTGFVNNKVDPKSNFPKKFKGYHFAGLFKDEEGVENPDIGIYKNARGRKGLAKIWKGRIKNHDYYSLRNEINVLKVLTAVSGRLVKITPDYFKDVKLQTSLGTIEKNNFLLLMTEFVKGSLARELPDREKLQVFLKAQGYIAYLGENLTKKERSRISDRTIIKYLLTYPFILVKAIILEPYWAPALLRGMVVFLKSLSGVSKVNHKLVHNDFNFNNILISGRKILILDLQYCVFTFDIYEFVTALHYNWEYKQFSRLLIKNIKSRFNYHQDFGKLFAGLCVNSATHCLADNSFSKDRIKLYKDFLNFSLKLEGHK